MKLDVKMLQVQKRFSSKFSESGQSFSAAFDPNFARGKDGLTAYEVAVKNGFIGSEQDWLASLKGETGPAGEPGSAGHQGLPGMPGKDGYTPQKGVDYFDGITPHVGENGNWFIGDIDTGIPATGPAGNQGLPGVPGEDGHTPIRGVDYFTPEDIEAMRFQVLYKWPTYVESDGASYIDTGFIPDQDTRVVCNVEFTTKGATEYLFGARASSSAQRFTFYIASAKYNSGYYSQTKTFAADVMYTDPLVIDKNRGVITLNGEAVMEHTTTTAFVCPCTMTVFALNTKGTKSSYAKAKLYSMQIYDNDVLVRDFIPCFNNCLGEYGLYDRLNDRFYRNLGTGTLSGE